MSSSWIIYNDDKTCKICSVLSLAIFHLEVTARYPEESLSILHLIDIKIKFHLSFIVYIQSIQNRVDVILLKFLQEVV